MKRMLCIALTVALLMGMLPGVVFTRAEATGEEVMQWSANSVQLWNLNAYLRERVDWLDIWHDYDADFLNYQMTRFLQDAYPGQFDEEWNWMAGRVPADVYEEMLFSLFFVDTEMLAQLRELAEYDAQANTYGLTFPLGAGGFGQTCFYRGYVENNGVIEVYSENVSYVSLRTEFESWEAYDAFLLETVGCVSDELWIAENCPEFIEYNGTTYYRDYWEDNGWDYYDVINEDCGNLYRFDFINGALRLLGEDTFEAGEMPEVFADDSVGVTFSGEKVLCTQAAEGSESWIEASWAADMVTERFAAYEISELLMCENTEFAYQWNATFAIPLPENFSPNVEVYLLSPWGELLPQAYTWDAESQLLWVEVQDVGTLALLDMDAAVLPEPEPPEPAPPAEDGPIWIDRCGEDVVWELMGDGTLYLHGTGPMYDFADENSLPWMDYLYMITRVVVDDGVTHIGDYAFCGCWALEKLQLGSGVNAIGQYAFYGTSALKELMVPGNVQVIEENAFSWSGVQTISFEEGITTIGKYAFWGCEQLTEVTLPASMQSVGSVAFGECYKLTQIRVSEDNEAYTSVDGVLYSTENMILECYPAGRAETSFTIGNGTYAVRYGAFVGCPLQQITVADGVSVLDSCAFWGCYDLERVTIAPSVRVIGDGLFYGICNAIEVTFTGDAPEFYAQAFADNVLTIHYPANNDTWTEAVMQPYGGTVTWIADGQELPEPGDQVTITFDANGGEGVPESMTASFGDTVVMPSFVPARFGYTFLGWSLDPNAEYAAFWPGSDNMSAIGDTTLYAVWEKAEDLGGQGGGCERYMDFAGQCHYYVFTADWSDEYRVEIWGTEGTKCTVYSQDGEVLLVLENSDAVWLNCASGQTYFIKVEYMLPGTESIGVMVEYVPPIGGDDDWWPIAGDVNADGVVDTDDAIYLLYFTLFGEEAYPVWQNCDYDGSGEVDTDDAIYLLYHTLFGEEAYPL